MKLQGATVRVTGANRGLGLALARAALERGAREPEQVKLAGVVPLRLDLLDEASVAQAARRCDDVTLVVNSAGIASVASLLDAEGAASMRQHLETNFFGMLRVSQQFAPVLRHNAGGALLNVLSVVSFINSPVFSAYSVSKTAAWGLTNALRNELGPEGTQVLALQVGFIDTDLVQGCDIAETVPEVVAARAFDALESDASEVMADEGSQQVKARLSAISAPYLEPTGS